MEWNRFYSFVFRCVTLFFKEGLKQIQYNKNRDNYLAHFNNVVTLQEFERIIGILINEYEEFTVNDFLKIYYHFENTLKFLNLFNKNNVKKLIDVWLKSNHLKNPEITIHYKQSGRKWIINKV
jgi:hypothetical protein